MESWKPKSRRAPRDLRKRPGPAEPRRGPPPLQLSPRRIRRRALLVDGGGANGPGASMRSSYRSFAASAPHHLGRVDGRRCGFAVAGRRPPWVSTTSITSSTNALTVGTSVSNRSSRLSFGGHGLRAMVDKLGSVPSSSLKSTPGSDSGSITADTTSSPVPSSSRGSVKRPPNSSDFSIFTSLASASSAGAKAAASAPKSGPPSSASAAAISSSSGS